MLENIIKLFYNMQYVRSYKISTLKTFTKSEKAEYSCLSSIHLKK